MALRNYSSTAVGTTLTADITTAGQATCTVAATTGFPAVPFIGILDPDTTAEEVVLVTNVATLTLTITRGYDGSTATTHAAGHKFEHSFSAIDFREPNTFLNSGGTIGGNVVVSGTLNPTNAADTATAASHYFVEVGSNGLIVAKTLANVKAEVVTTAAVNTAAATTTGTVTSGIWSSTITSGYLIAPEEKWNVVAAAIAASTTLDFLTAQNWYYTTASTAGACALNVRGSSGTTLATMLTNVGDSVSFMFIATTGASTPGYFNAFTIDGTATGVTTYWQYNSVPTSGTVSARDAYSLTVLKTAATPTYTVFAAVARVG